VSQQPAAADHLDAELEARGHAQVVHVVRDAAAYRAQRHPERPHHLLVEQRAHGTDGARVADEEPVAVALLPVDGDQRRLLAEDRESTRQPWQDADSLTGTSAGLGRVRGRRVQSGSRHLLGGRDLRAEVAVRHAGAVASWSRRVDAVIGLSG